MLRHRIIAVCILSLSLIGCGTSKPVSNMHVINVGGGIAVEIWANTDLVQPGESIKFRATVTNHGTETFIVEVADRPVLDMYIAVGPLENRKVIHWSDSKALTPDLTRLVLQPGEAKLIEMDYPVRECCAQITAWASFMALPKCPECFVPPSVDVFVKNRPVVFGGKMHLAFKPIWGYQNEFPL